MGRLVYSMLISLDGYVADEHGRFAWATPDDEVLRYVTERFASVVTYLYGRRMYETMVYWETAPTTTDADPSAARRGDRSRRGRESRRPRTCSTSTCEHNWTSTAGWPTAG